jgi:hypothetical protein
MRDVLTIRKFQALWKEYHAENKAINSQPPTSANYLLRMYPNSLERDALLQEQETMWDYKYVPLSYLSLETRADSRVNRAYDEYKDERASIEAQYNEAKEQVVQRLLASMEERRRKLREEKEGGEIISG